MYRVLSPGHRGRPARHRAVRPRRARRGPPPPGGRARRGRDHGSHGDLSRAAGARRMTCGPPEPTWVDLEDSIFATMHAAEEHGPGSDQHLAASQAEHETEEAYERAQAREHARDRETEAELRAAGIEAGEWSEP